MSTFPSLAPMLLLLAACSASSPAADEPPTEAEGPATGSTEVAAPVARAAVHTVVFIGQAEACQCTQDRVAASWEALSTALADRDLPVERLDLDVDGARSDELAAVEAFLVLPALYFLDEHGAVVEMLQGEVSAEDVQRVLDPTGT